MNYFIDTVHGFYGHRRAIFIGTLKKIQMIQTRKYTDSQNKVLMKFFSSFFIDVIT